MIFGVGSFPTALARSSASCSNWWTWDNRADTFLSSEAAHLIRQKLIWRFGTSRLAQCKLLNVLVTDNGGISRWLRKTCLRIMLVVVLITAIFVACLPLLLFYFILSRVKPKLSYKWDLLLCFPPSGSWFFNQCQWINAAAQIGKRPLSKKKKLKHFEKWDREVFD